MKLPSDTNRCSSVGWRLTASDGVGAQRRPLSDPEARWRTTQTVDRGGYHASSTTTWTTAENVDPLDGGEGSLSLLRETAEDLNREEEGAQALRPSVVDGEDHPECICVVSASGQQLPIRRRENNREAKQLASFDGRIQVRRTPKAMDMIARRKASLSKLLKDRAIALQELLS
jgi:hypothetical protein